MNPEIHPSTEPTLMLRATAQKATMSEAFPPLRIAAEHVALQLIGSHPVANRRALEAGRVPVLRWAVRREPLELAEDGDQHEEKHNGEANLEDGLLAQGVASPRDGADQPVETLDQRSHHA